MLSSLRCSVAETGLLIHLASAQLRIDSFRGIVTATSTRMRDGNTKSVAIGTLSRRGFIGLRWFERLLRGRPHGCGGGAERRRLRLHPDGAIFVVPQTWCYQCRLTRCFDDWEPPFVDFFWVLSTTSCNSIVLVLVAPGCHGRWAPGVPGFRWHVTWRLDTLRCRWGSGIRDRHRIVEHIDHCTSLQNYRYGKEWDGPDGVKPRQALS